MSNLLKLGLVSATCLVLGFSSAASLAESSSTATTSGSNAATFGTQALVANTETDATATTTEVTTDKSTDIEINGKMVSLPSKITLDGGKTVTVTYKVVGKRVIARVKGPKLTKAEKNEVRNQIAHEIPSGTHQSYRYIKSR